MNAIARGPAGQQRWTVLKVLSWTKEYFVRKGVPSARHDAETLLAYVLGMQRIDLYTHYDQPLTPEERDRFRELVLRRGSREPLQYLTGEAWLCGLPFSVDRRVLIPRNETEMLVEDALRRIGDEDSPTALDLCTGSGAIAVALLARNPRLRATAIDISLQALDVASINARRHAVQHRLRLLAGDLFAPLEPEARFDLIAANPPYIASADIESDLVDPEVRLHEPRLALDGGANGLDLIVRIVEGAAGRLRPGGWLLVEIGWQQGPAALALAGRCNHYESRSILPDLAGRDRLLVARTLAA